MRSFNYWVSNLFHLDSSSQDDDYYNNDVNKYVSWCMQLRSAMLYSGSNRAHLFQFNTCIPSILQPWYADQYGKCIFEEVCSNFRSVCRKYDPDATHYEDYFSCTAVNFGGAYGYLGPHCRSDGRTIGIGVYKDNKCNDYTGDTADITTATGMSFDDGELKNYYDKNCISCTAEEGYSLITDDVLGSGEDLTYPLCTLAYQVSGKCDRHMSSSVVSSDDYVYFEVRFLIRILRLKWIRYQSHHYL